MRRRTQLLLSDEVQYSLLFRVTLHWVLFMCANCLALAIWIYWIDMPTASSADRQEQLLRLCIPLMVCSLVVVPVFLYDVAKLSNQFAGPIRRIRSSLTAFINHGKVELINLRQNDFWQSLAEDVNKVVSSKSTCETPLEANKSTQVVVNANYPES